jgi:deazaflavin-dependent oxidoreductase (nitroreductase family)
VLIDWLNNGVEQQWGPCVDLGRQTLAQPITSNNSTPLRGHMSFDTATGTRGARQPGGRALRQINKAVAKRLRRKGGKVMGFNALVLTTIGRKSGLERTTPVGWFPGEEGSWLIVASAAGAARNPDWYYNIAANPDQVQIEVEGRKIAVIADQLHGSEREEAWQQIIAAAPRFAQYEQKTDRQLPVIRLALRTTQHSHEGGQGSTGGRRSTR